MSWAGIFVTWGLFAGILVIIRFTLRYCVSSDICRFNLGWWIMSFMVGQGCHASHATKKSLYKYEYPISLRLCFITGMLFGLLINIIYSSTILSALSVPISVIQSFEDLLEQGYKFSTHHLSQPMQNVLKTRLEVLNAHREVHLVDNAHQISHILEGKRVATLAYFDYFYREALKQNYSTTYICRTIDRILVSPNSKPFPSSFVAPKGSKLKEYFNYGLIRIRERGLHNKYSKEYDIFHNNFVCETNKVSWDSVAAADVYVVFFILFIGLLASLAGIVIENLGTIMPSAKVQRSSINFLSIYYGKLS
ncbi:uncharacterized protein LOC118436553 [Folsomia candida]|uniref:uncharacterized protein LOC118436553 n=1 Tax=Folsomia candida TaxID=158441 RepID=UPI00160512FC|nr:uncharacterized protein LOC118436553 [Folsomia candida]